MPRKAREKHNEAIYHIMCRSISEILLFKDDDDKNYYLGLLKRYTEKYKCRIYAYCLLDSHLHLHLDPAGFDVSKFMHSTNLAYVRYYNIKYKRHGHVFQERFESRILDSDQYNLTVSAYIHNNPKDIEGYNGKEHLYPYSSYGIYLGIRKDTFGLVDISFIKGLFSTDERKEFGLRYGEFAGYQRDVGSKDFKKLSGVRENEYRSGRRVILREHLPGRIMSYLSDRLMITNTGSLMLKSKQRVIEYRAICVYAMRILCGLYYSEICNNMYNMTVSGCARLCSRGYELVSMNAEYGRIFNELAGQAA